MIPESEKCRIRCLNRPMRVILKPFFRSLARTFSSITLIQVKSLKKSARIPEVTQKLLEKLGMASIVYGEEK